MLTGSQSLNSNQKKSKSVPPPLPPPHTHTHNQHTGSLSLKVGLNRCAGPSLQGTPSAVNQVLGLHRPQCPLKAPRRTFEGLPWAARPSQTSLEPSHLPPHQLSVAWLLFELAKCVLSPLKLWPAMYVLLHTVVCVPGHLLYLSLPDLSRPTSVYSILLLLSRHFLVGRQTGYI